MFEVCFFLFKRPWLRAVAGANLVLGSLFTLAAFLSGYQASEFASQTFQVPDEALGAHSTIGRLVLFATIPVLALFFATLKARFNKSFFEWSFRIALTILTGLVLYTGYLGGQLVFTHGAGVRAVPTPSGSASTDTP